MTCLWPYEMLYFFLPYVLLLPNSVLAHLIIWMHTIFFFVYLNLTGYQIKAWNIDLIYILMNEN